MAGPLAIAVLLGLAVLVAFWVQLVERCESTPCDNGTPTLLDGECLCTAPAQ